MTAWRVAPATASTPSGARAPCACGDDPKAIEQNSRLAECFPLVRGVAEDRLVHVYAPVRSHGVRPSVLLHRRAPCFGRSMVYRRSRSRTTGLTRSPEYSVRSADIVVPCASGAYRRCRCAVPTIWSTRSVGLPIGEVRRCRAYGWPRWPGSMCQGLYRRSLAQCLRRIVCCRGWHRVGDVEMVTASRAGFWAPPRQVQVNFRQGGLPVTWPDSSDPGRPTVRASGRQGRCRGGPSHDAKGTPGSHVWRRTVFLTVLKEVRLYQHNK